MKRKGQLGFVFVIAGLLMLVLGVIVFSLLSPVLGEFIEVGVNASNAQGDTATSFFISLYPIWIVFLLLATAVFIVSSGGGRFE